jgi:tRNA nucleotidyltransferase (CCA-adding enzyme)
MEDFIPTKEEIAKIENYKSSLNSILLKILKELGTVEIKDVGSTVKGTFVRGSTDLDLYVISENPEKAYKIVQEYFPRGNAKRGQLTIWNTNVEDLDIDFIFVSPKFSKREDTFKHAEFYSTHLNKHMKFEIIRAKAYLKTKGLYGAEMGSIVGVCIEELIRQKKTWLEVCKFLAFSPKRPTLQDPTMTNPRDFLASITKEKYPILLKACFDYIQNPHFKYKPMTMEQFIARHEGFCVLIWERKEDKALDFQSIHSSATHIRNIITNREKGEATIEFDTFIDNSSICLVYKAHPKILSPTKEVCLDPKIVKQQENIKGFTDAHKDFYQKDGLVCAMVKRAIPLPEVFFVENIAQRIEKKGYKLKESLPYPYRIPSSEN